MEKKSIIQFDIEKCIDGEVSILRILFYNILFKFD